MAVGLIERKIKRWITMMKQLKSDDPSLTELYLELKEKGAMQNSKDLIGKKLVA